MAKKEAVKLVKEKTNYEVPAFVLGILSIIFSATFISPFAGLVCGIIGLIESRKPSTRIGRQAKILNIIGIILSIILAVVAIYFSLNPTDLVSA